MNQTLNNRGIIISIGAIKIDNTKCWKLIDEFYTLVSLPENVDYINEYVTVLTGIKKEDLIGKPAFCESFTEFLKWSKDCKYIYCWGTTDIRSIYYTIKKGKNGDEYIKRIKNIVNTKFIDLKKYISKLDPDTRYMGLMDIYEKHIQSGNMRKHHTPVYDSVLEMKVHQYYINEAKKSKFDFEKVRKELQSKT